MNEVNKVVPIMGDMVQELSTLFCEDKEEEQTVTAFLVVFV